MGLALSRSLYRRGGLYGEAWPEKAEKHQPTSAISPRRTSRGPGTWCSHRMPAELQPEWPSRNPRLAPPGLPKDHLLWRPTPILAKLETSLNVLAARHRAPSVG